MQAQDLKGVMYLGLSREDKERFEEIRNTPPTNRHKEWLFKKLAKEDVTYTRKLLKCQEKRLKAHRNIKNYYFRILGYYDFLSHRN